MDGFPLLFPSLSGRRVQPNPENRAGKIADVK
jgi:hypothetical protein